MLKRRSHLLIVTAVFGLLLPAGVRAQEGDDQKLKPIVTVAFSGYGALISDLNFVGERAGNPQLGGAVEMSTLLATGGREIQSLDKSKPWGVLAYADGPEIRAVGFLPVSDLEEVKTILESNAVELEEAEGYVTASFENQKVHLKGKEGWLFLSNSPEGLDALEGDPAAALQGLEKSYNLAVRLDVQNVPEPTRQLLLGLLESGMQGGMMQMPGESDEQYALRAKMAGRTMEEVETAVRELDAIQLGLAIDEEVPSIYLDVEISALAGTETAKRLTAGRELTTQFAGFLVPDAALAYNAVGRLAPTQVDQMTAIVDDFRQRINNSLEEQDLPEADTETAKKLVDEATSVVVSTIEDRDLDVGVALLAGAERATWLSGFRVADGSKVEEVLKTIVQEAAKEMPDLENTVELDAAEHEGVRFHTLTVPSQDLGSEAAELFGEELPIVVGASEKAVYAAVGTDAVASLKKAIDESKEAGEGLPPSTLTVSARPIARLLAAHAPQPATRASAEMLVEKLADAEDKDRLTIVTRFQENGQKIRVEMEEDLLDILGVLPTVFMGGSPAVR